MSGGPNRPDPELVALIETYCNGTIEAAAFARLEQRLQVDATARAFFRQYLNLDAGLRDYGDALDTVWATPGNRTASAPWSLSGRRRFARNVVAGLAAAVAVSALVFVVMQREGQPPFALREEAMDDGVAVLTRTIDVVWAGDTAPRTGAVLPRGVLKIKSGIVQLEFYSGARVTLEGPAEFELVSIDRGVCRLGKLRAEVPAQAKGFRIDSPQVELVDLGTEFGMEVGQGKQTDVFVFTGKVELLAAGESGTPRQMLAGTGRRFDADGSRSIGGGAETFVSAEELERRATAESAARYQQWRRFSDPQRRDPRLLLYYTFEDEEKAGRTLRGATRDQNGAIVGCAWTEGRWPGKGALEFKRPGDRVRVQVNATRPSLTWTAWVRIDGLDHRFNALLLTDNFQDGEPHWQIGGQGQLILGLQSGTLKYDYASEPVFGPATFGQWTHLATVYDAQARTVGHFVNGQRVSSEPLRFDIPLHIGLAEIGNWKTTRVQERYPMRNLNGRLDEIALFGAALAAQEIRRMYEAGKPRS